MVLPTAGTGTGKAPIKGVAETLWVQDANLAVSQTHLEAPRSARSPRHDLKSTFVAWGPATLWAVVLFVLSSLPSVPGPSFPLADKVGHLGLYGILGMTLAWGAWRTGRREPLRMIALGVLYGMSDEFHQGFVPGRDPSVGDLVTDAVGVTAGYLLFSLILNGLSGRRNNKDSQ